MTANPNPYFITFHADADGGPEHLLWLLREYVVEFRKKGRPVGSGMITEVKDGKVSILPWDNDGKYAEEPVTLDIFSDFDEVVYL